MNFNFFNILFNLINSFIICWFFSTNHKDICFLYLCFGLIAGILVLLFFLLIRIDLVNNKKEVFKSSFFGFVLFFPYQKEFFIFFDQIGLFLDSIKPIFFFVYFIFVVSFYLLLIVSFIVNNKYLLGYYSYVFKSYLNNNKNDSVIIKINEFNSSSESSNTPEPKDPKRDRIKKILYALLGSVVLVSVITTGIIYYTMQPQTVDQFYLVVKSFLGFQLSDVQFTALSLENQEFILKNDLFGFPKGGSGSGLGAGSDTAGLKDTSSISNQSEVVTNNNVDTSIGSNSQESTMLTQVEVSNTSTQNLSTSNSSSTTSQSEVVINNPGDVFKNKIESNLVQAQGTISDQNSTSSNLSPKPGRTLNLPVNNDGQFSSLEIQKSEHQSQAFSLLYDEYASNLKYKESVGETSHLQGFTELFNLYSPNGTYEKKDNQELNVLNDFVLNHFFSQLDLNIQKNIEYEDFEIKNFFNDLNIKDFIFELGLYINECEKKQIVSLYHIIKEDTNLLSEFEFMRQTDDALQSYLNIIHDDYNLDYLKMVHTDLLLNYQNFNNTFSDIVMDQEYMDNILSNLFLETESEDCEEHFELYRKYNLLHNAFPLLSSEDLRFLLLSVVFLDSCKTPYINIIKFFLS